MDETMWRGVSISLVLLNGRLVMSIITQNAPSSRWLCPIQISNRVRPACSIGSRGGMNCIRLRGECLHLRKRCACQPTPKARNSCRCGDFVGKGRVVSGARSNPIGGVRVRRLVLETARKIKRLNGRLRRRPSDAHLLAFSTTAWLSTWPAPAIATCRPWSPLPSLSYTPSHTMGFIHNPIFTLFASGYYCIPAQTIPTQFASIPGSCFFHTHYLVPFS